MGILRKSTFRAETKKYRLELEIFRKEHYEDIARKAVKDACEDFKFKMIKGAV